jgi:SnoaL-like domain
VDRELEIDSLLSKQAITEVLYRYARALDRCDIQLLRSCFHPDSAHDHGDFEGSSADFCNWAMELLSRLTATQHHIGNILIDDLKGDTARTETYWVAYHRIPAQAGGSGVVAGRGEETDLFIGGRYLDRFERRGGEWKIARRVGIHDWQRFEPANDGGFFQSPPEKRGRRDAKDPVYHRE